MMESGLIKKWQQQHWPTNNKCLVPLGQTVINRDISLDDAQGAFYIYFIGVIVSLLSLVGEMVYKKAKTKITLQHIVTVPNFAHNVFS